MTALKVVWIGDAYGTHLLRQHDDATMRNSGVRTAQQHLLGRGKKKQVVAAYSSGSKKSLMGPEITVAGWLASPLITRLTKLAIDHYLQTCVKQKLKKLQINLNKVRTIAELEKLQFESQSLRDWLWRFKEAVCFAEDVIDSLELQLSGNKYEVSSPASSCLMPELVRKFIQKALLFAGTNDESDNFMRATILFPARRKIDRGDIRQLGEVAKTFADLIHEIVFRGRVEKEKQVCDVTKTPTIGFGKPVWNHILLVKIYGMSSSSMVLLDAPANAEALKNWKQRNAKAEFVLKRSISHEIFEHIMGCASAREIWDTLDRLFNKKNEARLQLLENELAVAKQDGMSCSEFFLKVKNLCSEISLLNPEEKISNARLKRYIIRGLRPEYTPFVTSIQGWAQQSSLEEFENLLSSQELLARQMAGTRIKEESSNALFTKKGDSMKDESKPERESSKLPKKSFKCYRCGKLGHIKRNCRVKLKSGNYADVEEKREEQKEENWSHCFLADSIIEDSQWVPCLMTEENLNEKISTNKEWIVDSGCGHHITGDESILSRSWTHDDRSGILTADNTVHKIRKEGTVVVDNDHGESITLNSVYHVPGIQKNLFSVANAVDAGNFVLFGPRDVKFLRNVKEIKADVVHTGTRVKDLFVLSTSNSYIEKMRSNDTSSLWHARLGHINMTKMRAIIQKKLVEGLPDSMKIDNEGVCEGCQFGKSHRLPFQNSTSRCMTPLERIHSDLMGPTKTTSYSEGNYMLLFVDDYSRFTWVYFVKHKSETFSIFLDFKKIVEGELGRKIKTLRTDNGGEFCSNEFLSFCRDNGIKRELSCPDTPQQNGVAERKIRHLVETCKSWLHAKKLSKELWAEGMNCAAHVINRTPLSSTNNKAPYELLYGVKPNVKHFRVFGSLCYVHLQDSQRSKLDAKAVKCVFVGYDERRKGWRCLDPTTNKCVVSRNVIFDEISSYHFEEPPREENDMVTLPLSRFPENSSLETQEERGSVDQGENVQNNQRPRRNVDRPPQVARLQEELSLRFDMKKLGEVSNFLGIQIENLDDGVFVSQSIYAKKLVEKFGMINGKKRSTPLDVGTKLHRDEGTQLSDLHLYRVLVGSLIYLTITRPDIAFSVGLVSRYMQAPRKPHLEEAKNILKYINSTLDMGLFYKKGAKFSLEGFVDADFDHICDGEFFRLEDGIEEDAEEIEIPTKAHHVYVTADNFVRFSKVLQKRKILRSLVVDGRLSSHISNSEFMDSLREVLKDSSRLRLLMLSELPGDLPDAIVHLRHLRYLEFPDTGVNKLPKSFCRLYHRWRLNLKTGSKHLLCDHNDVVLAQKAITIRNCVSDAIVTCVLSQKTR
ncbi:hypothetical protein ZIOFF_027751 [Zingiber officinale]|uniref:Retrovirus-related Pol polyprotein from transposon TNT 1-94 n=1 Tax=Zingiber officinale TaxID=94328 RepID=A0A8J5GTW8_ZINOF|nr:hypothetical protein ZIOFF_027751 [Zingiber officinale]